MNLLLPELERQLRTAARARRAGAREEPAHRSHRRAVPAIAVALTLAVMAAIAFVLASGIGGGRTLAAAQALERAAQAAQQGLAAPTLAPGEYWYTRSIKASTTGFDLYGAPALIQSRQVVESWQATDGSGRERSAIAGTPAFSGTAAERALFDKREARAPKPAAFDNAVPGSGGYRSSLGLLSYGQVLALPTHPAQMLARIRTAALSSRERMRRTAPGSPIAQQSLTQFELEAIAGALVDLPLTPGSRAAIYRAMEHIAGVSYVPSVRDPLGRQGAALASKGSIAGFIDGAGALSKPRRVTNELIFDPRTGVLLAEQSVLDQPIASVGLPAGYPIEYTAYVTSGNVSSTHQRFVARGRSGGSGSNGGSSSGGSSNGGEVLAPAPSGLECSSAGPAPARLISAPIPAAFLHEFAVLRRPATDADHLPTSTTFGPFPIPLDVSSVLENSVRLLRVAPGGARDYMLVGYPRVQPALPARRCLPGLSRAQYERQLDLRKAALKAPPQPVICVLETGGSLGFGCLTPAEVDSIDYETSDYGRPPATVTGIVPDGVGEVRASYPHGRSVTTHVEDNLLVYKVGLVAPNAMPESVTWLDADGRVIRRIAQP